MTTRSDRGDHFTPSNSSAIVTPSPRAILSSEEVRASTSSRSIRLNTAGAISHDLASCSCDRWSPMRSDQTRYPIVISTAMHAASTKSRMRTTTAKLRKVLRNPN